MTWDESDRLTWDEREALLTMADKRPADAPSGHVPAADRLAQRTG